MIEKFASSLRTLMILLTALSMCLASNLYLFPSKDPNEKSSSFFSSKDLKSHALSFSHDAEGSALRFEKSFVEKFKKAAESKKPEKLMFQTVLLFQDESQVKQTEIKDMEEALNYEALNELEKRDWNIFCMSKFQMTAAQMKAEALQTLKKYETQSLKQKTYGSCNAKIATSGKDSPSYAIESLNCDERIYLFYPIWIGFDLSNSEKNVFASIGWPEKTMLNKFFTVELVQIESKLHAYIASVEEGKYFHVSYELNQGTELKSKDVSVSLKRLVSNAEVDNANYKSIDLARDCLFSHALCQDKIEDKSLSLTSIIKVYKLDFKVKMVTASLTATTSSDGTKASLTIFLSQKITINESSKDGSIRTEVETGIGMNVGKKVLEDLTNVFIDFKRGSFLSAHFAKHDLLTKYSKFLTKEDQILSAAKSLYFYCEPETEEIKNFENFSSKMLEFYKEDKFYRISLTDDQGKLNFLYA